MSKLSSNPKTVYVLDEDGKPVQVMESTLSANLKTAAEAIGAGLLFGGIMAIGVFLTAAGVKASKKAFGEDVFDADVTQTVRLQHYHVVPAETVGVGTSMPASPIPG